MDACVIERFSPQLLSKPRGKGRCCTWSVSYMRSAAALCRPANPSQAAPSANELHRAVLELAAAPDQIKVPSFACPTATAAAVGHGRPSATVVPRVAHIQKPWQTPQTHVVAASASEASRAAASSVGHSKPTRGRTSVAQSSHTSRRASVAGSTSQPTGGNRWDGLRCCCLHTNAPASLPPRLCHQPRPDRACGKTGGGKRVG